MFLVINSSCIWCHWIRGNRTLRCLWRRWVHRSTNWPYGEGVERALATSVVSSLRRLKSKTNTKWANNLTESLDEAILVEDWAMPMLNRTKTELRFYEYTETSEASGYTAWLEVYHQLACLVSQYMPDECVSSLSYPTNTISSSIRTLFGSIAGY